MNRPHYMNRLRIKSALSKVLLCKMHYELSDILRYAESYYIRVEVLEFLLLAYENIVN